MPRMPQRIALFVIFITVTINNTPGPFAGCDTGRALGGLRPLHGRLRDFRNIGHGYPLCRPQRLSMYPVAFSLHPVWTREVESGMLDS